MMFAKCILAQIYSVVSISYYTLLYTMPSLFGFAHSWEMSKKRVVDPATRRRNVALSGREGPVFIFTFCLA